VAVAVASWFDERVYDGIGRVVAEWSELRRQSAYAYHLILNRAAPPVMNDASREATAQLLQRIDGLWDETKKLLRDDGHPPEELTWFRGWVTQAKVLKRRRNDVDHAVWATNGNVAGPSAFAIDSTSVEVFRTGGGGMPGTWRLDLFPDPLRELPELAWRLCEHSQDLSQWNARQSRRLNRGEPALGDGGDDDAPRQDGSAVDGG
jgi:hypothetical protein